MLWGAKGVSPLLEIHNFMGVLGNRRSIAILFSYQVLYILMMCD
jgi:hypothetical protein